MSEYNVMFTMYIIVLLVSICLVDPAVCIKWNSLYEIGKTEEYAKPLACLSSICQFTLLYAVADNINGQHQNQPIVAFFY